jgi:hypothetical protein
MQTLIRLNPSLGTEQQICAVMDILEAQGFGVELNNVDETTICATYPIDIDLAHKAADLAIQTVPN